MKKLNSVKLNVGDMLYVIDVKQRKFVEVELTLEHLTDIKSKRRVPKCVYQDYCLSSDIVKDINDSISLCEPRFYDNMSTDYGYTYQRVSNNDVVAYIDETLAEDKLMQLVADYDNQVKYDYEYQLLREKYEKDLKALKEKYQIKGNR